MHYPKGLPPQWPIRLIERFCDPLMAEVLYGDVREVYYQRLDNNAKWLAVLLYYRDAFSLLRPFAMKQAHQIHPRLNFVDMFRVYLSTGIRSLLKHPTSSGINIFGLFLGLTAALLIAQYTFFELRYDRFHSDYESVYRVIYERRVNNETVFNGATTYLPVGPALKELSPGVEEQVRLYFPFTHAVINYEDEAFSEEQPVFADQAFFQVFDFQLIEGRPESVFSEPNKVVLSESLAFKYFGNDEPIGKTIEFSYEDGRTLLEVSGVMNDPRADSHLRLEMLISFKTLDQWSTFEESQWFLPFYHTYIKTNQQFVAESFKEDASDLITKNAFKRNPEIVSEIVHLQELKNIHLDSDLAFEMHENGNRLGTYFLILVAIIIVVVAYLNYVNLSTALAVQRAKEVGVRKVMGSSKAQLVQQFLVETFLLNLIAFIGATIVAYLLTPIISQFLSVEFGFIKDPIFWGLAFGLVVLGSLLSGFYPSLILSGYKPVEVLKGRFFSGDKGVNTRKLLVSIQYVISMVMVGGTIVLFEQTNYLLEKDLGFNPSQILVVNAPRDIELNEYKSKVENFATDVLKHSGVMEFTHSGSVPGKVMSSGSFQKVGDAEALPVTLQLNSVDYGFFETYDLEFLAGRPFTRGFATDTAFVVLNESALRVLGFKNADDALSGKVQAFERELGVLGVISDYHHDSPKSSYQPTAFVYSPQRTIYFSLQVSTSNLRNTLDEVEKSMTQFFPKAPFDYFFLEDSFDKQFESDTKRADLFRFFAMLAVVLGAMGFMGLTSFIVNQKIKEIGVRRVLGASFNRILTVFIKVFRLPLLIGSTASILIIYFGGNSWLRNFPFRIELGVLNLLIPLMVVAALTILIIGYQTIRVMQKDPIKSLRQE